MAQDNILHVRLQTISITKWILTGHYYHCLSVDTKIMVSKTCPSIGEHVGIIFVTL